MNAPRPRPEELTGTTRRLRSMVRCIPLDILLREVSALHADINEVKLTFKESTVNVNGRCEIHTLPAGDFPEYKDFDGVKVEVPGLAEKFKTVLPAAGERDTRYMLNAVLLDLDKGYIVATDGHRLHIEKTVVLKGKKAVIPSGTAELVIKHSAELLKLGGNRIAFKLAGGEMTSTLMEGTYPDYEKVIPKENPIKITFKGLELLKVLDGALPATTFGNVIKLTIDGSLEIEAVNPDLAHYKWHIPCTKQGGDKNLIIGFNARYLIDAVRSYGKDEVVMEMSTPLNPCVINSKAVVMPVRI